MKLDPTYRLPQTALMTPVCPKCDIGLFILRLESVEVDYCDRCRGVWLDAGELEQLADISLPDFQRQVGTVSPGRKHLCPRCDARMEEITSPGNLTLDKCPRGHGLWFDTDELQQLLATCNVPHLNDIFGKSLNT
jgi:Zn-finger nucleic acid-binding protein